MSPKLELTRHAELDAQLRGAMCADPRITHALAYGSFTQGTADRFSDLEYWLYLRPDAEFDVRGWLEKLVPVLHFVVNEFGTPTAILPGLLRLELHAVPNTRLAELETWGNEHLYPERMRVKDVDGRLAVALQKLTSKAPPEAEAQATLDRVLNWLTFGLNVLARGERIRAHGLLWWIQGGLLSLAAVQSGQTEYLLNPARLAERRLNAETLRQYAGVTGGIDDLEQVYSAAVDWTLELAGLLGLAVNAELDADLRERARMST
ncbi:hypothetical protein [Deinococcus arenicola]|uniref:Lincosamide nucleotidyltransferase-like C-terminal domain-containing protein n=1 Tax=Deinococcus arenicola TaxID=2994950 RepID=A0ABU4DSV7_9DEIO|nr:hypothetical protein [Deinococcus sp. ZS9-10]MDV6375516.1 hypothetical protein [Deinococcus sp. ZS9-10]